MSQALWMWTLLRLFCLISKILREVLHEVIMWVCACECASARPCMHLCGAWTWIQASYNARQTLYYWVKSQAVLFTCSHLLITTPTYIHVGMMMIPLQEVKKGKEVKETQMWQSSQWVKEARGPQKGPRSQRPHLCIRTVFYRHK